MLAGLQVIHVSKKKHVFHVLIRNEI
jgi:hypothetical protein